ncbi:dockerin type I domain-containing protein [Blautia marasmi]|uniref:dockerin type I domain-containing protein n=1 Tax=Blautia marasmi TaxID=1917868 RepID=UPI001D091137|nr:dockerin type I domain-containing protein [Blautia marasmi]MCB6193481.1 dockerin type I domain-containing protein [Blautia marasmi]
MMKKNALAIIMAITVASTSVPVWANTDTEEIQNNVNDVEERGTIQDNIENEMNISSEEEEREEDLKGQEEPTESEGAAETDTMDSFYEENSLNEIQIPDQNLRNIILNECDIDGDERISKEEIESLETLSIGISESNPESFDLDGLENAVNLKYLTIDMDENNVVQLFNSDKIGSLINLLELDIRYCRSEMWDWLNALENLENLSLQNDGLTVLPEVDKLDRLSIMDVSNNELTDISSVLGGMSPNFYAFYCSGNNFCEFPKWESCPSILDFSNNPQMTDLTALCDLLENDMAGEINLTNNPQLTQECFSPILEQCITIPDTEIDIKGTMNLENFFNKINSINSDVDLTHYTYTISPQDTVMIENNCIKATKPGEAVITLNFGKVSKQFKINITTTDSVYFPDEQLRNNWYIKNCDKNGDGIITKKELEALTSLTISANEEVNLEGIEYIVNLEELKIEPYGPVDALKVTQNYEGIGKLVKLKELSVSGGYLGDLSILAGLQNLQTLKLHSVVVTGLAPISQLSNLEYLNLTHMGIGKIPNLDKLEKLSTLDLSDNYFKDISSLVSLPLSELYLKNNRIESIPEWVNFGKLNCIDISNNPLSEIGNLNPLLNAGVQIYANESGISFERQFQEFYDTKDRNISIGNRISMSQNNWIITEDMHSKDIVYKSENQDGVSILEDEQLLAKQEGTFTVSASYGNVSKEFKINVLPLPKPVSVTLKESPEMRWNDTNQCIVLNPDKSLWSINGSKSEKVREKTKNYIAEIVYGKEKAEVWADFLLMDDQNSLWECKKKDFNSDYSTVKISDNVKAYDSSFFVTDKGFLYEIKGIEPLAENVAGYQAVWHENSLIPRYIYTTDFKVKDIVSDKILLDNYKGKCIFNADFFIIQSDKKVIWYDYSGNKIGEMEDIEELYLDSKELYQSDGKKFSYYLDDIENKIKFREMNAQSPKPPYKQQYTNWIDGRYFILDDNNVLWLKSTFEGSNDFIPVVEDVEGLYRLYNNSSYYAYLTKNCLYEASTNKLLLEDIKQFWQNGITGECFYLKTDGSLCESDKYFKYENKILSDVSGFVGGTELTDAIFITRKDQSIWKYDTMYGKDTVAYIVKTGSGIGDIDGDGKIKIADILVVLHFVSGTQTLNDAQMKAADIDYDGKVTIKDILRLLHYVSGNSSAL